MLLLNDERRGDQTNANLNASYMILFAEGLSKISRQHKTNTNCNSRVINP